MSDNPSPGCFDWLAAVLRHGVVAHVRRHRASAALAFAGLARVRHLLARVATLLALFRAGRLPARRAARGAGVATAPTEVPNETRSAATWLPQDVGLPRERGWLPRERGWLACLAGADGDRFAARLRLLLDDEEMVALAAASPLAGRLLRALWRMASTDELPATLRPRRTVRIRARRPRRQAMIERCRGRALDRRLAGLMRPRQPVSILEKVVPDAV